MDGEYANKVVVVSGGSRGIGRGIGAAFAAAGAQVVLAASSAERLDQAAGSIAAQGGVRPQTCAADLRTEAGCAAVHRFVADRFGRCDILANSAGATRAGAFLALDEATWQDGFALKFFGCVRL